MGKKNNLTVRRLTELVDDSLKPQLDEAIAGVLSKSAFAFDWRNRYIAHRDLDLSMGKSAASLSPASRLHVKDALEGLCNVLNLVDQHYTESTVLWGRVGPMCGAGLLLDVLKDGLKAGAARRERLIKRLSTSRRF
jgi:hypothetical protein